MKIDFLEESPERVEFKVKGASIGFLNTLRRIIISELPCFAVDEVDFFENTSAMYNEYLANRIGLIPLTWEEGTGDDVKIVFTLEAEGPGTAYASDLKSTDEKIMVHSGGVPIIKLGEGQKLRLEATAIKGVAKTHAKFQCALAGYGLVEEKGKKKGEEAKFFVESYNNVPAVEQLQKALEMVKEKTEKLKKEFK